MNYTLTSPCKECPFLAKHKRGYTIRRLEEMASGEFPCHKTADVREDDDEGSVYVATTTGAHCAGALIYLEKRDRSHQMMRICERLGMYDRTKLDMEAKVR